MSEKSSFLQFFDNENIGKAYQDIEDERQDLKAALFVVADILEKTAKEAVSASFAKQDLSLMKFYFESRRNESVKIPLGDYYGFFGICRQLELNVAEMVMLHVVAAKEILDVPRFVWNKLKELKGGEVQGMEGASWLYQVLADILEEKKETVREEKVHILFCRTGAADSLRLRRAVAAVMKNGLLDEQAEYVSRRFCRRVMTDGELQELILQEEMPEQMMRMVQSGDRDTTLCIRGERGCGKTLLAAHLGRSLGRNLMILEGERLADYKKDTAVYFSQEDSREWFYEWLVQVRLGGDLVVLRQVDDADRRLVRSCVDGLLLVLDDQIADGANQQESEKAYWQNAIQIEIPYPDTYGKSKLWDAFLQGYSYDKQLDTMTLASKYVLNAGGIKEALFAADAHARGLSKEELDMEDLQWAIRQSQSGGLGQFAHPISCIFDWNDLVVEEQVKKQMRYVCAQIQYKYKVGSEWGFFEKMPYGRGVSALFYGPPGTGKTMAAQVMARELGYDLYRVDLSQMVSKYIGETEKNISQLFERARHMNVILFFDEADALFSKRSEVKDAHDRNANTEVAHLLQQMEGYEGIILLATNLKDNMDDAFKRRIKFMINFSFPSVEIRKKLWRSILPEKLPRDEKLDLDFFAERFELSGSQIKDVMLAAAFIAAEQQTVLGNEQVKEALCMNYQKYGKMLTKNDFGYLG